MNIGSGKEKSGEMSAGEKHWERRVAPGTVCRVQPGVPMFLLDLFKTFQDSWALKSFLTALPGDKSPCSTARVNSGRRFMTVGLS